MDNPDLAISIAALKASEYSNKSFDELILATNLGESVETLRLDLTNGKYPSFFSVNKKSKIKCLKPSCQFEQEIVPASKKCPFCGELLDFSRLGVFRIDLDYKLTAEWLNNITLDWIKEKGFTLLRSVENYSVFESSIGFKFSVLFSITPSIEDYYLEVGHSTENDCMFKIIIGINLQNQLSVWSSNKPEFIALKIPDLFCKTDLEKEFKTRFAQVENSIFIQKTFCEGNCETLAKKVGENFSSLYKSLPQLALQMGEANASTKGNTFQKNVLRVLNSTIFNAIPIGGKNSPDGAIMIYKYNTTKSITIPLDVKSYVGAIGSAINLTGHYAQFRKYIKAFKSDDLQSKYTSPAFVVIAYDFNLTDANQNTKLSEIETEFGVKFILFPVESLVYLAKVYSESKIFRIAPEVVANFFNNVKYVKKDDIDNLIKLISDSCELQEAEMIKQVRKNVATSGF